MRQIEFAFLMKPTGKEFFNYHVTDTIIISVSEQVYHCTDAHMKGSENLASCPNPISESISTISVHPSSVKAPLAPVLHAPASFTLRAVT